MGWEIWTRIFATVKFMATQHNMKLVKVTDKKNAGVFRCRGLLLGMPNLEKGVTTIAAGSCSGSCRRKLEASGNLRTSTQKIMARQTYTSAFLTIRFNLPSRRHSHLVGGLLQICFSNYWRLRDTIFSRPRRTFSRAAPSAATRTRFAPISPPSNIPPVKVD